MFAVRLILVVLSCLLLGAHFFRDGNLLLMIASILAPVLVLIPRAWALWAGRVALTLGSLEWVRTLVDIASDRRSMGTPWIRMAAILGVVALIALLAAVVFPSRRIGSRHS